MTRLAYLLLGIIAQASVAPCNETGNDGSFYACWQLASSTSDDLTHEQMCDALALLLDAGLVESAMGECDPARVYRLCAVPLRASHVGIKKGRLL